MPQIEQLPFIFTSQLFWLLVVFGIIFFGIGRGMLPKIQSTVELASSGSPTTSARARRARGGRADRGAWRARMDEPRAEAARLPRRRAGKRSRNRGKVRGAAEKINAKVETAEQQIRDAVAAARAEIEAVTAERTQDMVARLTGIQVDRAEPLAQ
jgi:F-type H+-transporting ATPase subunit b